MIAVSEDFTSFLVSLGAGVFITTLFMWMGYPFPLTLCSKVRRAGAVIASRGEPMKMTLVVRRDLKMGTGKIAAQCAHAAVAVMEEVQSRRGAVSSYRSSGEHSANGKRGGVEGNCNTVEGQKCNQEEIDQWVTWYDAWCFAGRKKVALQCDSEEQMMIAYKAVKREGLPHALIRDAGRTQIAPGSKAVLAVGPAPDGLVDRVTGHFKLL
uniref:peptidyl-tRNA hydrolase n=1 Tax=Trypanosoma congolense (strain IL3000) TaxID=1068625 RepID=G0UQH9_TRYCI|nr:conserved hypothetical protein [Trypanosoma congolense IL3000]